MAAERPAGPGLDLGLLVLRLSAIGMIVWHGWGKLTRLAGGDAGFVESVGKMGFPVPVVFAWAAVLSETLLPALLVAGLFTRPVAAICAFNMAVAAFLRHRAHLIWMNALGLASHPTEVVKGWGNPELALMYLAVFLALALAGGGRFAVDRMFGRRRR